MTPTTTNLSLAIALAAMLGAAHHLDPVGLLTDDPNTASELSAAQLQAQAEHRRELAAARHCTSAMGPGAAHRISTDGRITCHSHRSTKPLDIKT